MGQHDGNWAASCIAYPCSASMMWPAKMREAGDAIIATLVGTILETSNSQHEPLIFITLIHDK